MDISYVCLIMYNGIEDFTVYKLPLGNDALSAIRNSLEEPSTWGMKKYSDVSVSLESPKKYSVVDSDTMYHTEMLKDLMKKIEDRDLGLLQTWNEAFSEDTVNTKKIIAYYNNAEENEVHSSSAYIYALNNKVLVKNKIMLFKKRKFNATDAEELYIEPVEGRIDLPVDKKNCIVSFHKKIQETGETRETTKVNVYNALGFDELFETFDTQKKYVENTLNKFSDTQSPTRLTTDKVKVQISENDEEVRRLIYSNKKLTKTFASFTGSTRNTIQKIKSSKVKDVLEKLNSYVQENADSKFEIINIPKLIEDDEEMVLQVDVNSAPIFAALLENKIIQRLLNDEIQIPYYNND